MKSEKNLIFFPVQSPVLRVEMDIFLSGSCSLLALLSLLVWAHSQPDSYTTQLEYWR